MAHPMRSGAIAGHSAKLHRMTRDYGSADPKANIMSPTSGLKAEGPEDAVGFGAESEMARAKGDRPARRSAAANPVPTYAKGGAVNRARGGRTKNKGTHVNVIVAPQAGNGAPPMPPPVMTGGPMVPPAAPPAPPPKPLMGGPGAMPGAGPALPMPPGAMPPGAIPPRARGGKVNHADAAEDKALIKKTLKDEGLIRSDKEAHLRARGGRLPNQKHNMTAGAVTGIGRLEKIGEKPKAPSRPQAV